MQTDLTKGRPRSPIATPLFFTGVALGATVASLVAIGAMIGLWRVGVVGAHDNRVSPLASRVNELDSKLTAIASRVDEALLARSIDGSEIGSGGNISRQVPAGEGWQVQGIGDFNGDGKADILWRNPSGTTNIYLMNGRTVVGYDNTSLQFGNEWRIRGIGDFNGDGKSDILWRRTDGATSIWLMDGVKVLDEISVPGSK